MVAMNTFMNTFMNHLDNLAILFDLPLFLLN